MSISSSNQSSLGNNHENIQLQFETLLNNPNEWNNNELETTRQCFRYLYLLMKENTLKIEKLERLKATKTELNSSLNIKANIADIMKTFNEVAHNIEQRPTKEDIQLLLDEKANRADINNIIMTRPSLDEIKNILANGDLKINLKNSLDEIKNKFVPIQYFNDLINTKANKDNVINALHNKANKNELIDIQNQINNFNLGEINNKIIEIDNDLDRLIESIKKQFSNVNNVLNEVTTSKADYKEIEGILTNANNENRNLSTKISKIDNESSNLKNEMVILKNNINSINTTLNILDDKIKTMSSNNNNTNDNLYSIFNDKINKLTEQLNQLNNTINNNTLSHKDMELINQRIDNINNNTISASKIENYCSFNDLDNLYKTIKTEVKNKLDEVQMYTHEYIKNYDNDLQKTLNTKVNTSEIKNLLNNKADIKQLTKLLESKANKIEIENMKISYEKIAQDYINKIDYSKFDSFSNEIKTTIEALKEDLTLKPNIKEIINFLKSKCNIDDVNKALIDIHNELDNKISIDNFNNAMNNQTEINKALIKENYIGKWNWISGDLKNGFSIPWEEQIINTQPENYSWEKDDIYIKVNDKGIYNLNIGIFTKEKSNVQIIINGDIIYIEKYDGNNIINNNENYGLNAEDKEMNILREDIPINGISINKFFFIGEKSRVTISYIGNINNYNNKIKGFLSLKKIC